MRVAATVCTSSMCVNVSCASFVVEVMHLFHPLYNRVVHGGISEETPHVGVCAP